MLTLCRQLKRLTSSKLVSASTSGSALSCRLPLLEIFDFSKHDFNNGFLLDAPQHIVLPRYAYLYLAASMMDINSASNVEKHEEKQSFDSLNGTAVVNYSNSNAVAMDTVYRNLVEKEIKDVQANFFHDVNCANGSVKFKKAEHAGAELGVPGTNRNQKAVSFNELSSFPVNAEQRSSGDQSDSTENADAQLGASDSNDNQKTVSFKKELSDFHVQSDSGKNASHEAVNISRVEVDAQESVSMECMIEKNGENHVNSRFLDANKSQKDCQKETIYPMEQIAPDSKLSSFDYARKLKVFSNCNNGILAGCGDSDPDEDIVFKGICSSPDKFPKCNKVMDSECRDADSDEHIVIKGKWNEDQGMYFFPTQAITEKSGCTISSQESFQQINELCSPSGVSAMDTQWTDMKEVLGISTSNFVESGDLPRQDTCEENIRSGRCVVSSEKNQFENKVTRDFLSGCVKDTSPIQGSFSEQDYSLKGSLNVDHTTHGLERNYFEDDLGLQNQSKRLMAETEDMSGEESGIHIYRPPPIGNDIYIILDLNGVLIKRWDKHPSIPGVRRFAKKWVQLRPGCIEFLKKTCTSFKVGIWSTMRPINVELTWKFLEKEAKQSLPFFMIWGKDYCYQEKGVSRPDKLTVAADFKPLSKVWDHYRPDVNHHNTVLVDDSPYKACMNSPYNCIFPDTFNGSTDDNFLTDCLWPYFERMRLFPDVQSYIAENRLGQQPISVSHKLYRHVRCVMQKFY